MDKQKKNLLVFGYGLCIIFSLISLRLNWKFGWGLKPGIFMILGACFLLLTLFRQDWLKAIYERWMAVAHKIGTVVTTVILTLIFFCVFTPVGIVRRLFKKDWLKVHLDPSAASYWIQRNQKPFNKADYTKQF